MTEEYLFHEAIDILPWPTLSPDLNPIESVWGMLVRDVYANFKQYDDILSLVTAIADAWHRLEISSSDVSSIRRPAL